MSLYEDVYHKAKETQQDIATDVQELEKLNNDIKSNRYTEEAIRNELYPKRDVLRNAIKRKKDEFLKYTQEAIEERKQEINNEHKLNPKDITDDIKLLQLGITLSKKELNDILERNKNNNTMVQLIIKYAKQNNIDIAVVNVKNKEFQLLDSYYDMTKRYVNHFIDNPTLAERTLERNFGLFI